MTITLSKIKSLTALLLLCFSDCAFAEGLNDDPYDAVAYLVPLQDSTVTGSVKFKKVDTGVRVVVNVEGLTPGEHGFHIHEYGDCSSPDGSSAGGHFNPTGKKHGSPEDADRHVGDLGNIFVDESGQGSLDFIDSVIELDGPNTIIGRGVIIHSGADDFITQPTGASGSRVACGVIELVE